MKYNNKYIGSTMPVLVEEMGTDGLWRGKTNNYISLAFAHESVDLVGKIIEVKIEKENLLQSS